jgi:hypothetical protein
MQSNTSHKNITEHSHIILNAYNKNLQVKKIIPDKADITGQQNK